MMNFQDHQLRAAKLSDKQIADARFILKMKDRWDNNDYMWDDALWMEQMNRKNARKGA